MRDQGEIRTLQQWVPGPSWASHYMELFYFAIYDKKRHHYQGNRTLENITW